MSKAIIFIAALILLACSSPARQPIRYCADERLRAPAEAAAERWTAAAIWVVVDSECDPGDGRIGVSDSIGRAWGRGGVGTVDETAWVVINISMLDLDAIQLESLMVHELGHSLGAEHHVTGPGIMRAKSDRPGLIITEHDLLALCSVAACDTWQPEDEIESRVASHRGGAWRQSNGRLDAAIEVAEADQFV